MKVLRQIHDTIKFIVKHPLNGKHKFRAVVNFLKWQLSARVLGKRVIVPWVEYSMFITGLGEAGLTGNLYAGVMEYEDMAFLLHALQPTEIFVDVGANVGAYTILASKVVKAKSIAFEPLPDTIERLTDQVQINRIHAEVDIRNMGVGDSLGSLFFTNNNDTVNKVSLIGEAENTTKVKVTTLDIELPKNQKYFLKIDVEGFEWNVLNGASDLLSGANVVAIIIELNGSGEEFGFSNEDIHNKILSFGFCAVRYEPKTRCLSKLEGYNKNNSNTIYVKDVSLISNRCKLAPERVVHTAFGVQI